MNDDRIVCCICRNEDQNKFRLYYAMGGYNIMQCTVCDLVFVPSFFRKDISYTAYKDASVTEQVRKGNNWIKVQRHLLRCDLIKKYKSKGKLFDLGSGWGHFLLAAKQSGYEIYGVELSEQQALYAKNDLQLPVDRVDFFAMPEEKKFDVITMWDVLEHIDAADEVVSKCARLLNPDGIIVIQVPQIDSFISRKFRENWKMLSLDHVNYFSTRTLPQLLQDKGFTVKTIRTSLELKLFLQYTVLPFLKKIFPGNKKKAGPGTAVEISSTERQVFFNKFTNVPKWVSRIFLVLHNFIYKTLSLFKIGEEMIVIAQKK